MPAELSGTFLTSLISPFNRRKENKFACVLGETNPCAMVAAKGVNGDKMRTKGFVSSICPLYIPLGYKNASHLLWD